MEDLAGWVVKMYKWSIFQVPITKYTERDLILKKSWLRPFYGIAILTGGFQISFFHFNQ